MYAKLFTSLYQGTLRGNSHGILVFTNLLAHADKNGNVDIHPRAISDEVGLTLEQVRAALDELEAPDVESRSPEEEGRRIIRADEHRDWGWNVVNYLKYRAIRNDDDRREQNRMAQANWREKRNQSKPASAILSQGHAQSAHTEAEAEVEVEAETKKTTRAPRTSPSLAGVDPQIASDWIAMRKQKRAAVTETAVAGIRREAEKAGLSLQDALAMCCARGWTGFKAEWVQQQQAANGVNRQLAVETRNKAVAAEWLKSRGQHEVE